MTPCTDRLARGAWAVSMAIGLAVGLGCGRAAGDAASPGGPAFGLRPALAGRTTLSGGHFAYALPPGGGISDRLQAVNLSADPLTVDLYAANVVGTRSGAITPGQRDDPPSGATGWVRLAPATLVIPPRAVATEPFTVAVPPATAPGDYLAALVGSLAGGTAAGGLMVQSRVALIVKVTVPGAVHASMTAGPLTHRRIGGTEHLEITVTNPGNVVLNVAGTLRVSGGPSIAFGPSDLYVIPGGQATLTADWRHLPVWSHSKLDAQLAGGLNGTQVVAVVRTTSITFVPWRLITGALAVGGSQAAIALLGRSRLRAWWRRRPEERAIIAAYRAGTRPPHAPS